MSTRGRPRLPKTAFVRMADADWQLIRFHSRKTGIPARDIISRMVAASGLMWNSHARLDAPIVESSPPTILPAGKSPTLARTFQPEVHSLH